MSSRKEFEMSEADLAKLMEASQPVMAIALQCGPISSPQENANRAWASLGKQMGFDPLTVEPVRSKGNRYFTAETTQ